MREKKGFLSILETWNPKAIQKQCETLRKET